MQFPGVGLRYSEPTKREAFFCTATCRVLQSLAESCSLECPITLGQETNKCFIGLNSLALGRSWSFSIARAPRVPLVLAFACTSDGLQPKSLKKQQQIQ